jgi:hypothetical protein
MSPEAQLELALGQWHQLASAEAEAIHHRNWTALATCQAALHNLQPEITRCLQALRQHGADSAGAERLRARAAELQGLEQHNLTLLQAAREAIYAKVDQCQQATRTLRRLRASYAPHPSAAWTSYS